MDDRFAMVNVVRAWSVSCDVGSMVEVRVDTEAAFHH